MNINEPIERLPTHDELLLAERLWAIEMPSARMVATAMLGDFYPTNASAGAKRRMLRYLFDVQEVLGLRHKERVDHG